MATGDRVKRTLRARQARIAEIDKEVEAILNERGLKPAGSNTGNQSRPIGIQQGSTR
jgi:hypothetical protein